VETPPALALVGLPPVAVVGRTYEMRLEGSGQVVERDGATLGVHDARGVGWSAHYEYVRGVRQAFSVGLNGPFTVTASYTEPGPCTRTLSVPLPTERRILAVRDCRHAAIEPRAIILRCRGKRLRLRDLAWTGWNGDTAVGRGSHVRVVLSHPRECSTVDGFIYTRASVNGGPLIPIACPI
jgi:hypothetical protein